MRIDKRLAERFKKINPSETLAITAKVKKLKAEGHDVINFAAGEPDFDTPDFIKEAAIKAINSGFTKYTPASGIPELKESICKKFKTDNNIDYSPNQVIVSCGAKHSIFNALFALIAKGDEILIPSPYWVSYPEMVNLCEGTARFIKTTPENNFKITPDELRMFINSKTKILILNSPSNPTGSVYSEDELKQIADICVKEKLFVLSDEIYEKLTYNKLKHISIASLGKEIYDLTITVNGVSKAYAMTGWRIGYLGGPPDIVDAILKLQSHSTSNPASISQKAAYAALSSPPDFIKSLLSEFQKRRDRMLKRLDEIKNISYIKPYGAFYVFCDISKTGLDSLTFTNRLLDETAVSVIPGAAFGRGDYIRLSFATDLNSIGKGIDRINEWVSKL